MGAARVLVDVAAADVTRANAASCIWKEHPVEDAGPPVQDMSRCSDGGVFPPVAFLRV